MMAATSNPGLPPAFIGLGWLDDHPEAILCDARAYLDGRHGYDAYRQGHIPGARFVDLDTVLAGPPGPIIGRHPLPDAADFADSLSDLGIGAHDLVIAYDDAGGMMAGRLVWMLRVLGQPAAVLDGGLDAWCHAGRPLEAGVGATPRRQPVPVRPWPTDAIADADQVQAHLDAGGTVVDSRAAERYRGEVEPIDPRAGHIPGAINLPFSYNTVDQFIRPIDELQARFATAGVDANTIFYCGSGVSACLNVLAAEYAQGARPLLYVGSWSGWSSDPTRP